MLGIGPRGLQKAKQGRALLLSYGLVTFLQLYYPLLILGFEPLAGTCLSKLCFKNPVYMNTEGGPGETQSGSQLKA